MLIIFNEGASELGGDAMQTEPAPAEASAPAETPAPAPADGSGDVPVDGTSPASGAAAAAAAAAPTEPKDPLANLRAQMELAKFAEADRELVQQMGVKLLTVVSKLLPGWVKDQKRLFEAVLGLWKQPETQAKASNAQHLSLPQMKESKRLVKFILSYVQHHHEEISALFDLLWLFSMRLQIDFTFLREFYQKEVAEVYTTSEKRAVLMHFLALFKDNIRTGETVQHNMLVPAMKLICMPMIQGDFPVSEPLSEVIDDEMVRIIMQDVLDPPEEVSNNYTEELRIELLQLTTLMIRHLPAQLMNHRKELIKFGWNHLKREDASSKHWAFVNVCHFLEAYQAPDKIILQVFVALLRIPQQEHRVLVRQALDTLTPALPHRLPGQGDQKNKYPMWIRYTKQVLVEEGHSMPHLVHIWRLLVRHAPLFMASRAQFVPQMVNSLSRLGLPTQSSTENRWLAIDLAALVMHWEKQRIERAAAAAAGEGEKPPSAIGADAAAGASGEPAAPTGEEQAMEVEDPADKQPARDDAAAKAGGAPDEAMTSGMEEGLPLTGSLEGAGAGAPPELGATDERRERRSDGGSGEVTSTSDEEFKPNTAMEEVIVNFLIRMAFRTGESKEKELIALYKRTTELLSEAMALWPNANAKFGYMDKLLATNANHEQDTPPTLVTGLDVLNRVLVHPQNFVRNNLGQIVQMLDPCCKSHSSTIHAALCTALKKACSAFPEEEMAAMDQTSPITQLRRRLENMVQTHLQQALNSASISQGGQPQPIVGHSLACAIRVLDVLTDTLPASLDRYIPFLAELLKRLGRDVQMAAEQQQMQEPRTTMGSVSTEYSSSAANMVLIIDLVSKRVLFQTNEHRTAYFRTLLYLMVDKPTPPPVLTSILKSVCTWVDMTIASLGAATGALSNKELLTILVRLAKVTRIHAADPISPDWERQFLGAVYRVCTLEGNSQLVVQLRNDVFKNVERIHLLGLRSQDPEFQQKFFALHHETIGRSLFLRLQYIVSTQEWEAMSDIFWLNHGIDLLLSILVEKEPIKLAPNSAQIPELMDWSRIIPAQATDGGAGADAAPGSGAAPTAEAPAADAMEVEDDQAAASAAAPASAPAPAAAPAPSGTGTASATTSKESDIDKLITSHAAFLAKMSTITVKDLIKPLQEVAGCDGDVAYHIWVLVFPIVWATLQKEEQYQLAKPMILLLSKEYHQRQASARPNVVQALLEGISLSQPQPKIPSDLLKWLGKTYNAWHIAIPLLENHVMLFPREARCFDALAELYTLLSERDVLFGLWRQRCASEWTRSGVALVQHGMWQEAQEVFYRAMQRATLQGAEPNLGKAEMCLWEMQWINAARHLGQWDALSEFSRSVDHLDMQLDCVWRVPDWNALNDLLHRSHVEETPRLKMLNAFLCLHEAKVQDAEAACAAGAKLALDAWWSLPDLGASPQTPLLHQFQQLVELQESGRLLMDLGRGQQQRGAHSFSDMKEILETWRLRTPNLWDPLPMWSDLLTWRSHMYSLVSSTLKSFHDLPAGVNLSGSRDQAWSVTKLATVARKQDLNEVAIQILQRHYEKTHTMSLEIQEAFVKLREQAKGYLGIDGEALTALNLISTANLEYFPGHHKAELFRLRGALLAKLGDNEGAHGAFATAVSLCRGLPESWISWGEHCDHMAQTVAGTPNETQWLEYAASCYLQGIRHSAGTWRSFMARVMQMLSFQNYDGVVSRALAKNWEQIPPWVWLAWVPQLLISLQRQEAEDVKPMLFRLAHVYPQGIYYPLRVFLLERRETFSRASNMARASAEAQQKQQSAASKEPAAATTTAAAAGAVAPAAAPAPAAENSTGTPATTSQGPPSSGLQSTTGAAATGGGDASAAAGAGAGSAAAPAPAEGSVAAAAAAPAPVAAAAPASADGTVAAAAPAPGAGGATASDSANQAVVAATTESTDGIPSIAAVFEYAKEVMERLRVKHINLATELEMILTEMGTRLQPQPEERLLAVVHALLHRCYKHTSATTAEVPASLRKELTGVCRACFNADTSQKHSEFVRLYEKEFQRELDPEQPTFAQSLGELMQRLKAWKAMLQRDVENRLPATLRLEEESLGLRDLRPLEVEMPGQYLTDKEMHGELVRLERIGPDVGIVRRHGSSHRRLAFIGTDGRTKYFLVQTTQTPTARGEERMMQLLRTFNQLLERHCETRSRHLSYHTPAIIPIWPQVRLVEDDLTYTSYGEAYEINCARYGREPDIPILLFKERLNQAAGGALTNEQIFELRMQAFHEITTNYVTENVFNQYMYKTLPTCNLLWCFKKQFCCQLALSGFASALVLIGGRTPNKLIFAKNTGRIFMLDFHPTFDMNGILDSGEPVPFRLTRNLETFFTPFGVEGTFVSAMCAAAQAVVEPRSCLAAQLALFFRDELQLMPWRRIATPQGLVPGPRPTPAEIKSTVEANVKDVMIRVNAIAPTHAKAQEAAQQASEGQAPRSVQRDVRNLVEAAIKHQNLARMDVTWLAWY